MSFFSQYTKEGHGISKEQANAPIFVQFFTIYFTRFWSLSFLNLIYTAFLVPGFALIFASLSVYFHLKNILILLFMILAGIAYLGIIGGPATAGLVKVLRNWSRREAAFIWGDFWETFKKNFKQASIVGLIDVFVLSLLLFNLYFYYINQSISPLYLWVVILTIVIFIFMNYYMFTMLVTFNLTIKQLYKNALIFVAAGIFRNIVITLIIAALTYLFVIFYFNPIFWIVYFLWFFGTCWYIITFITYPLIKRTMIDGFDPKTGEKLPEE